MKRQRNPVRASHSPTSVGGRASGIYGSFRYRLGSKGDIAHPVFAGVTRQAFDQSHVQLLATWLRRPHVARWYPAPDANLILAQSPPAGTSQAIIAYNTSPIGYIRWQRVNRETLDSLGLDEIPTNSVDIDHLLGEEHRLGKGSVPMP